MKRSLYLLFLLLSILAGAAGQRGMPPREGIGNFGQVNDLLYRGAQPDAAGIAALSRLGVKMIVNLRMASDVWNQEEAIARAHGILYTNIPLRGVGRPTDEQIVALLAILETSTLPVYVHCQHGCDRTGTLIACYRIKHDKWTSEEAMVEARKYGLSKFEWGMRRYVMSFRKSTAKEASPTAPRPVAAK